MSAKGISKKEQKDDSMGIIALKSVKIDRNKASTAKSSYDFFNPREDFVGIVECISDIRHIPKRGEMKQDLDVVDVKVIEGIETREKEEVINGKTYITDEQIRYENQHYSLVLTKAVLLSRFKALQEANKSLVGLKVVIVGLGKAEDKQYMDYYVDTYENAVNDGIIIVGTEQ